MLRNYRLYLEDIVTAVRKIRNYVAHHSLAEIRQDDMRLDAIIRNFEIIGVAAKNIPDEIKEKYQMVEWRKITDFRNILAHEYFGINYTILWDIITNKLPTLEKQLETVLKKES
jgi:uncharacterized protein with HEPN domain